MWANHNAGNSWDTRNSYQHENIIWDGAVDRKEFEIIAHRMIKMYFKHPSYYTINNNPVLMIYDIRNLLKGLGGIKETRSALDWFKAQCVASGLPGLHLHLTKGWGRVINLSTVGGEDKITYAELINLLDINGFTNYQYGSFVPTDRDYSEILVDVSKEWQKIEGCYDVPYFPHVSVGWDDNPRFTELRKGIVKNNTPANIEKAFILAKEYVDLHPNQAPLITVNSWNEWTETSYLQPDDLYGYGYLEAIKKVFC